MAYIVLRDFDSMGIDVPGYASLAAMLLFFSGMNMIGLGIIGEYSAASSPRSKNGLVT